jgi:hypothetical protein
MSDLIPWGYKVWHIFFKKKRRFDIWELMISLFFLCAEVWWLWIVLQLSFIWIIENCFAVRMPLWQYMKYKLWYMVSSHQINRCNIFPSTIKSVSVQLLMNIL